MIFYSELVSLSQSFYWYIAAARSFLGLDNMNVKKFKDRFRLCVLKVSRSIPNDESY